MKKITVQTITRSAHVTKVTWSLDGQKQLSNFYHHHDGSWGFDPAFSHQSPAIQAIVWALVHDEDMPKKARRTAVLRYDW